MATILTSSQQTFVDITDQRKLSAYITSNLPKTQSEDPNVLPHTYAPSWDSTNLILTPVLFLDQTNVSPSANGVTISWKRKDGVFSETALTSGETVKNGVLTVNQNKLSAFSSGMITYICYISYYDSETKNKINITADITYTLVKNAANAKQCTVSSDTYVFKYDTSQALVGASQATLTAQVQGVTVSKWQYKNSSGTWTDYPTTSDSFWKRNTDYEVNTIEDAKSLLTDLNKALSSVFREKQICSNEQKNFYGDIPTNL